MKHSYFFIFFYLCFIGALPGQIQFEKVGEYRTGIFDNSALEIIAYDPLAHLVFSTNLSTQSVDIVDIQKPAIPHLLHSIDLTPYGHHANSVDFFNNILVVGVEANDPQANGKVLFFTREGMLLKQVEVGPMPDMLTFSPNGCYIGVACEGSPSHDYKIDPEGSVALIDIRNGIPSLTQENVILVKFDISKAKNKTSILWTENTGQSFAQDLEPEYVSFDKKSKKLYVTLQENNAIAKIDVATGQPEMIVGLGFKDLGLKENAIDVSDQDGAVNLRNYKGVFALYQPDALKCVHIKGKDYILTANEGETKKNKAFSNVSRVKKLKIDATLSANIPNLKKDKILGRLKVDSKLGDTDGDGDFDELYTFGARSFSIWDSNLNQIYDSGSDFERILSKEPYKRNFNSNNDSQDSFDARSDDKGCEPEGIIAFELGLKTYALIGLDRMGGFMCYDISDPYHPVFINYTTDRNFEKNVLEASGLGPEGMVFISQKDSPIHYPLILVANEVSGQLSIFKIISF